MKRDRPFVTANFAITADGRISTRNRAPAGFGSANDKRRLHEIRASCDAVLAGARTVATDNMTMSRPPGLVRVLLSASGRIDPALKLFAHGDSPILIFSTTRMPRATRAALAEKATLHLDEGAVDLAKMMHTLRREHGVKRLVCEGGGQVFRALLAADLIDELHLTIVPRIFGGAKAPTLTGVAGDFLPQSTRLTLRDMRVIDGECFLRYRAG
ncbi:MAG: RibD family protein [Chthoniobacteraceae bacterium]